MIPTITPQPPCKIFVPRKTKAKKLGELWKHKRGFRYRVVKSDTGYGWNVVFSDNLKK